MHTPGTTILADAIFEDVQCNECWGGAALHVEPQWPAGGVRPDASVDLTVSRCNFIRAKNGLDVTQVTGGGAIYANYATLKISHCLFDGCEARKGMGGAIFSHNSTEQHSVSLEHTRFVKCSSTLNGTDSGAGAVYVHLAPLEIVSCMFEECFTAGYGGAILAHGNLTCIDSNFTSTNSSKDGGALYCDGLKADIDSTNFTECKSEEGVDFVWLEVADLTLSSIEITDDGAGGHSFVSVNYPSGVDFPILISGCKVHGNGHQFGNNQAWLVFPQLFPSLTVKNSQFDSFAKTGSGNKGGAFQFDGPREGGSSVTFSNCDFIDIWTNDGYGGAMCFAKPSNGYNILIESCLFSECVAGKKRPDARGGSYFRWISHERATNWLN